MRVLLGFISYVTSDAASGGACWLTFRDEVLSVYNVQLASEDFLGALRLEKNYGEEKTKICVRCFLAMKINWEARGGGRMVGRQITTPPALPGLGNAGLLPSSSFLPSFLPSFPNLLHEPFWYQLLHLNTRWI